MSNPQRTMIHLPKVRMLRGGRPASTIKITNVKSIKPPDPELVKKLEEEKLRSQLQKELASRSRECAHHGYECTETVLAGRAYCARHALEDPTAPYVQCAQLYPNGHRCTMLTPVDVRENRDHRDQGLCYEHARIAMLNRQRSAAPPPPVTTTETLLNQLQHYIRPDRVRTASCASAVSVVSEPQDQEPPAAGPVDPFKQIDAIAVNSAYSASIMECASDSESDRDSVTLGEEGGDCRGGCDHDSEHEDAPAERMPMWNAGVLTFEEAIRDARLALRSLQAAYARRIAAAAHRLRAERARYLRALRAERDLYCSINTQAKSGPLTERERRQLRKLKAYASYHRRHGVDAVLARKLHRKRARAGEAGAPRGAPALARCTFSEGGVRCGTLALPAAKHCLRHVLLDRHQVLYRACGDARGALPCREPVAVTPLCRYHAGAPPYVYVNPKKDASDAASHSSTADSKPETSTADLSTEGSCEDGRSGGAEPPERSPLHFP